MPAGPDWEFITLFELRCIYLAVTKHRLISIMQNGKRINIKTIKENDGTKQNHIFSPTKIKLGQCPFLIK